MFKETRELQGLMGTDGRGKEDFKNIFLTASETQEEFSTSWKYLCAMPVPCQNEGGSVMRDDVI